MKKNNLGNFEFKKCFRSFDQLCQMFKKIEY